ncbi:unnamed protein product [Spirodela intermedia]|uniref:WRKY domain-containing protein n=1 Tax=Spirodela intermedia TaxID=51605 RepID=A0A7I8IZJ2_SPIIN|nr:unnamed protein product [Spirodela intermedia]CAA6663405.1 unnamed protein product [Spirodela intermedia]
MDETQPPKADSQSPRRGSLPSPSQQFCLKVGEKTVVTVRVETAAGKSSKGAEGPPSDLWSWRKYGQKPIKGSPYPRGYYRCSTSKGCSAKKQVERSRTDPSVLIITYTSDHNHPARRRRRGAPPGTAAQGARRRRRGRPERRRPAAGTDRRGIRAEQAPLSDVHKEGNSPGPAAESPEEEEDDFFDELEELPVVSSAAAGWVRSGGSFDEKIVLPCLSPSSRINESFSRCRSSALFIPISFSLSLSLSLSSPRAL